MRRSIKSSTLLAVLVVLTAFVGSTSLSGQQPPLLDQVDVQNIIDFCMGPTGIKIMQPPDPAQDRALWCGGIAIGPAAALAGMVRNTQVLQLVADDVVQLKAQVAQLLLDQTAMQIQIISNNARITALEVAPINFQAQIDALTAALNGTNLKLSNAAEALQ